MNQWATNEEKQDDEKCGPFLETLRTRRAAKPSVVCLGDTEDSQKEESCNNQAMKEKRQRKESLWHLWTEADGWN